MYIREGQVIRMPAGTGHLRQLTTRVTHILPVSDDGGSTAEIVRVLGGPAVGDIRSRCLRLADNSDSEVDCLLCTIQNTAIQFSAPNNICRATQRRIEPAMVTAIYGTSS
jgi:hypothetical protein